jgi:hypothetical protein
MSVCRCRVVVERFTGNYSYPKIHCIILSVKHVINSISRPDVRSSYVDIRWNSMDLWLGFSVMVCHVVPPPGSHELMHVQGRRECVEGVMQCRLQVVLGEMTLVYKQ